MSLFCQQTYAFLRERKKFSGMSNITTKKCFSEAESGNGEHGNADTLHIEIDSIKGTVR